jgi:hypothetical protein
MREPTDRILRQLEFQSLAQVWVRLYDSPLGCDNQGPFPQGVVCSTDKQITLHSAISL